MVDKEKLKAFALKWWPIAALAVIFLFSFYIRNINTTPDRLLDFDPIFQYRFTKYITDWGHLPAWDELSYYMGRAVGVSEYPPFMWYLTSMFYQLLKGFGMSLATVASYSGALYGALITIPAFLLGRELSNKYGGLMAAALMGAAPQILIRTFGASYDNDQLVVFFILLTLFLGLYALRKRTPASILAAIAGFIAFMLTWGTFAYTFFILVGFIIVYFLINTLFPEPSAEKPVVKPKLKEKATSALKQFGWQAAILVVVLVGILVASVFTGANPVRSFQTVVGFAQEAERSIVNVSIAELQPFSIFNLSGWLLSMGRFMSGIDAIDMTLFLIFVCLMIFGLWRSYKRGKFELAFLLSLLVIGIYSTFRGIRFTEFTSVFFIIIIASGFGYLIEWVHKKDNFIKSIGIGLGLLILVTSLSIGLSTGQQVGPDINPNWDSAWTFLRTQTPENSLVGTWWDPGHMITGLADRRVIADGAHCTKSCLYTINDRITDLGRIMATTDENESVKLIEKYRGTSPKVYWIASDDLIGKYQWLQYFGLGCDARTDASCPIYSMAGLSQVGYGQNNTIAIRYYSNIIVLSSNPPIPLIVQGRDAAIFDEMIYSVNGKPTSVRMSDYNITAINEQLKPFADQYHVRLVNQTIQETLWIPDHQQYVVMIPPNLRNTVFTRMFMLDGQGLDHFKQVFANPQVKIYEVV